MPKSPEAPKSPKFEHGSRVTLISETGEPMYTGIASRSPFHLDRVEVAWEPNPVRRDKARGLEFHANTGACKGYRIRSKVRIRHYKPGDESLCATYQQQELERQLEAQEQDLSEKEELIRDIRNIDPKVWTAFPVWRLRSWHGELKMYEADRLKRVKGS